MKVIANFHRIWSFFGRFQLVFWLFPVLQTHSSSASSQNSFTHQPQVDKCKEGDQVGCVLGKTLVARFGEAELAFEYPKQMLVLRSNTRFNPHQRSHKAAMLDGLVQRSVLTEHYCHMPVRLQMTRFKLLAFFDASVVRISEDILFFIVRQFVHLCGVVPRPWVSSIPLPSIRNHSRHVIFLRLDLDIRKLICPMKENIVLLHDVNIIGDLALG